MYIYKKNWKLTFNKHLKRTHTHTNHFISVRTISFISTKNIHKRLKIVMSYACFNVSHWDITLHI